MKFFKGQRVRHPHHGEGVFVGHVLGSEDEVAIRLPDERVENVIVGNLEPIPYLGPRWLFQFSRENVAHTRVVVRAGTPKSRALCGSLVLTNEEARELEVAVASLKADVERE